MSLRLTKKVLRKKAEPVTFEDPIENQRLAVEMSHFMLAENGIGLSANQCGIAKRLFVMFTDRKWRHCFNPEIVNLSDRETEYPEGCLSFKGDTYNITRPSEVSVKYQDYMGNYKFEHLAGISARCFLHELDHLNGIVFEQRFKQTVPGNYDYANIKSRSRKDH